MKKFFITLTMVLLGLFAGVSTMWATNMSGMTDDEALTQAFWACMTAKPATTTLGSGLVFVSEDDHAVEPAVENYASTYSKEGWSDIYLASSLISATVDFKVYAKANAGSYFTGWSFTDGYTDLGVGSGTYAAIKVNPSPKKGKANILDYTVYAAFEQVKLKSYEVTGPNTMNPENPTCTQTVTFRAETPGFRALNSADDVKHFKLPVITPKAGTAGTWTTSITEWNTSNISFYGEYALINVPVTFTAPNSDPAEYGAELVLETYAGVKMTVHLSARTTGGAYQAIRYNKSKVQQETGDFATLLTNAEADDIIKLNSNYSSAVSINKNITLDLNGYTLSNTLTVSGGNVTIAYSPYGGSATSLNVTGGKAILNGGSFGSLSIADGATVEQNGATFTGAATNNGALITTDGAFRSGLTSTKTLTADGGTFNGATAIQVTGGTASIKRGTISGSTYGVQTSGGTTTIEKLAVITGGTKALYGNGGTLTVNNGKFPDPSKFADGEITFKSAYFGDDAANIASAYEKQQWRNTAGPEFREGYKYFVGDQEAAQASNVSVCRIGKTSYASLDEALAYANNHLSEEVIIIMENDYTLKAGYYTIPANATLIVPMSDDQETANPVVPRSTVGTPDPVSFRKLIFESGVNMEVAGTLEVTCTQYGSGETMGIPGGNFGHLILKPGSHMTINNGGYLRAWGFVTGDGTTDADGNYLSGEIDARRGGTVHEMFQMGDWKGGDISFTIAMEVPGLPNYRDLTHLFPVYTYFIQNVESPVKYHPGSALICATSVNVSGSINAYANDIKVVGKDGEAAMFLMDEMADAENTWVRKYYDAKKDQQVYEVNSGAKLGSVVINLGEVPGDLFGGTGTLDLVLDSRKFVLPLTNNFKIHLLSGYMEFTQSTSCLPGMEVEVDKEAEVAITKSDDETIVSGGLYLYDADQWSFTSPNNGIPKGYVGNNGQFGAIVRYSATLGGQPEARDISSPAAIGDAKLIVHGTFRMGENCAVYTTWSKDMEFGLDNSENASGGASIISTNEDAGTFIFDAAAPDFDGVHVEENTVLFGPNVIFNYDHNDYGLGETYPLQINTVLGGSNKKTRVYGFELCTSAKLLNANGTFTETEGTLEGTSYCYMNDRWTTMQVAEDPCFMKEIVGGKPTYYAKPAEYVAVNVTSKVHLGEGVYMFNGNADHTFSDKDGAGRLFIRMSDCQWWEVEKKDNLYHCIHPDNDTYYYWDDNDQEWKEKRFTITWKNWDGEEIKSYIYDPNTGEPAEVEYSVTYGTQAEFLGSNPTREPNIDYTYDFTGWSPALGPVTSNVTYTATYSEQPRKYAIIFTNEGGDEIERHLLKHNEVPVCENVPTKVGHTLEWEPAIAAVTGDAIYRATWLEEPPTEYAVTFFDYDGTTKLKPTDETPYMVAVGDTPTPPDDPAGKPATAEFTYVFHHWSPSPEEVSATSIKSYTAVYAEVPKTYEIKYYKEDGMTLISSENLTYGATPTPPAVTKEDPEEGHTYTLVWKTLNEAGTIQTVQGEASYKPTYLDVVNKYTVMLQSNNESVCTFSGAGIYNYGSEISVSATIATGYAFDHWDGDGVDWTDDTHGTIASLRSDVTLTLYVKPDDPIADLSVSAGTTQAIAVGTMCQDFILNSNGTASASVTDLNNLTIFGNCYYDLTQTFTAGKWYAIAVPWQVKASDICANGSALIWDSGNYLAYYDGAIRAAQGKVDACWHYISNSDVLQPGRLYMLYLQNNATVLRFPKKAGVGSPVINTSTSVSDYASAIETDANWNGIANPATYYAYLNAGATDGQGQVYNAAEEKYELFEMDDNKLIVGQPIFVQAPAGKSIVANSSTYSAAPARRIQGVNSLARYDVCLTAEGKQADRLIIRTDEDKEENAYVIGQDLVKFGVSTRVAQMWINRYDAKLCVNTVAPEGEKTEFPLSVFAPKAGEFTIHLASYTSDSDYTLYLTYNGEAIWNLSDGAYTINLDKGTDSNYGLRVSARAPQATTGIDEAIVDNKDAVAAKVLINGQVFIIRGDKVYTIDGQLVK